MYLLICACDRSGGRSSDAVVQDLALDILKVLPESLDAEENEVQTARAGQIPRPSIIDIVNIGSGQYFKLNKKRDSEKHSKGL